jgi:hypothetical protein
MSAFFSHLANLRGIIGLLHAGDDRGHVRQRQLATAAVHLGDCSLAKGDERCSVKVGGVPRGKIKQTKSGAGQATGKGSHLQLVLCGVEAKGTNNIRGVADADEALAVLIVQLESLLDVRHWSRTKTGSLRRVGLNATQLRFAGTFFSTGISTFSMHIEGYTHGISNAKGVK